MPSAPTKEAIIGTFQNGRGEQNDFLQFASAVGGNVFAWIDFTGSLKGSLIGPSNGLLFGSTTINNSSTPPSSGQCLQYNGTAIVGAACGGGGTPGNLVFASSFGVKGGALKICDASWGSGSFTVNINQSTGFSDVQFTPAMTGWIVYGSNDSCTSSSSTPSSIQVPLGTLTVASTGNTATVSVMTTGACTSSAGSPQCTLVIAPQDDYTALQNAWTATIRMCASGQSATLVLPTTNMFVSQPVLGPITSQCGVQNTADGNATTLGVQGGGYGGSVIFPSPSMNLSNCDINYGCFFTNPAAGGGNQGMRFRDFGIDGAGQQSPTNASSQAALWLRANGIASHVVINHWGVPYCIAALGSDGAGVVLDNVSLSSCSVYNLNAGNATYIHHSKIFWSPKGGLATFACNEVFGTCISEANQYEFGCVGSMIVVQNSTSNSVNFTDDHIDGPCANSQAYLEVQGGNARLTNITMDNPSATSDIGLKVDSGANAYVVGARILLNANSGVAINIAGSLFDLGGNTFIGSSANVITGSIFGSGSITGTAAVAGNWALSAGWGTTAAVSAVSGNTQRTRYTVTASGTGQAANPTITHTFATPFLVAPVCTIKQDGGTQGAVANPFTVGAPTATSVVYTYTGTPGAGNTLVLVEDCILP